MCVAHARCYVCIVNYVITSIYQLKLYVLIIAIHAISKLLVHEIEIGKNH